MKVTYTNSTGRLILETEAANAKAVFETLAELGEVFDETACGSCGSPNIRFDVRRPQSYTYYNLVCKGCGARLDFGQHVNGESLFAKRKDESGNPLPCNGWYHYSPEMGGTPPPASPKAETDPYVRLMASAAAKKDEKALRKIFDSISRDVADQQIGRERQEMLRVEGQRYLAECTGKPVKGQAGRGA